MIDIELWLKDASHPKLYKDIASTFEEGSFFCIKPKKSNIIYKYPVMDIFRVKQYDL